MPFVGSSSAKTTEVQKAQPKNARECHEGLKLLNLLNLNGDMAMLSISVPLMFTRMACAKNPVQVAHLLV